MARKTVYAIIYFIPICWWSYHHNSCSRYEHSNRRWLYIKYFINTFPFFIYFKLYTFPGIQSAKDVDSKYLHPIVRRFDKKPITIQDNNNDTKGKEMKHMAPDGLGQYMRVPSSPLSPPPNYDVASKETQTPGYYYYAHDTDSVTPPPPYINLANHNEVEQSARPLLYRLPSAPSTPIRSSAQFNSH